MSSFSLPAWARAIGARYRVVPHGDELRFDVCPFCGNRGSTHSGSNMEANLLSGAWHCWACRSGGALKYLLELLAVDYDGPLPKASAGKARKGEAEQAVQLPDEAVPILSSESEYAEVAMRYLRGRGMAQEEVAKYDLHYAPSGRFRGRIIFPFRQDGDLVWYVGRAFMGGFPKYIGPKGFRPPYVLMRSGDIRDEAVICEGPFDGVSVNRAGKTAVVLLGQGGAFRAPWLKRAWVMMDDDAGARALQIYAGLGRDGVDVRIARSLGDPGDMSKDEVGHALSEAERPDLAEVVRRLCASS